MIISHRHRFIFIKTKKTAGTSIEIGLSQICGPDDIITEINPEDEAIRQKLNGTGPQNDDVSKKYYQARDWIKFFLGKKKKFYNHMRAVEIRKCVDKSIWDSYYKFCFERDPVAKAVSHFNWRGGYQKYQSFNQYLESGDWGLIKGLEFYGQNGEVIVDQIYRLEDLNGALKDISKRLKLEKEIQIPTTKKSSSNDKDILSVGDLSQDELDRIRSNFRDEINIAGYSHELQ